MSSPTQAPDGLLLDLDGVFYVGNELIPGAREVVELLLVRDIPHLYVTNTTTRNLQQLQQKLQGLGLPITSERILSAPAAACRYLQERGLSRCRLLLRDPVKADFPGMQDDAPAPEAVVIGDIGHAWSYQLLNQAFRDLVAGAQLIALHKNRYWQAQDGLRLDIGAFVSALEYAADTRAVIIGKPSAAFYETALHQLGLPAARVAMVGDDIESDVGGAQACGMQGILVRTGKYRPELASRTGVQADTVIESVAELPGLLA